MVWWYCNTDTVVNNNHMADKMNLTEFVQKHGDPSRPGYAALHPSKGGGGSTAGKPKGGGSKGGSPKKSGSPNDNRKLKTYKQPSEAIGILDREFGLPDNTVLLADYAINDSLKTSLGRKGSKKKLLDASKLAREAADQINSINLSSLSNAQMKTVVNARDRYVKASDALFDDAQMGR